MKKTTIFLFGDSITRGSFDTEAGGWADRLKMSANITSLKNELKPIVTVFNLGIGGNTTADLLKRFIFETEQRITKGGDTFFIFSFGTNDSAFLIEKNQYAVNKDQYIKNIEQVIEEVKVYSSNIIFLTSPPVIEEKAKGASLVGKSRVNSDIQIYNESLSAVCEREKIDIIDINKIFLNSENYKDLFIDDGIHPNTNGHILIYSIVKDYLVKKGVLIN